MPALPLVANALKTKLLWSDDTDTKVTTGMFWRYSGAAPDATEATSLASALSTLVASEAGLWGLTVTFEGVTVQDLSTNMGGEGTHTASVAGTDANPGLAGGTATLVNFAINRRYRGGKPRIYLPWGSSAKLQSKQQWMTSYVSAVGTAMDNIVTGYIGSSAGTTTISDQINVSYYEGFTTFTTPSGRVKNLSKLRVTPSEDIIIAHAVNPVPSSQRRRNRTG